MSFESNTSNGVDPRVQVELEKLNTATDDINRLEVQIEEAKCDFKKLLETSIEKIKQSAHKLGNSIEAARPYYDARLYANQLSRETQLAALNYEKAKSIHAAAKEMVNLAELGVGESSTLDAACQEMLSHATSRVTESQLEVCDAKNTLKICELKQEVANNRVGKLQAQLKSAIKASRPYYETRANYNGLLKAHKQKINQLESQVSEAKMTYNEALKNLEKISEEIHKQRQERLNLNNLTNNFDRSCTTNDSTLQQNRIDCKTAANISLQPLHSGLNRIILDDEDEDSIDESSSSYSLQLAKQRSNLLYSNQIDCCDEYMDLPSKITYKSSPIRPQQLDDHDCPHLLKDFHHNNRMDASYSELNSNQQQNLITNGSDGSCVRDGGIYITANNTNRLSYYTNNSDDDKLKEASSSGVSNDVDDIEQWTEIRLSNSNSSSSGYSHHESLFNADENGLIGLTGCGVSGGGGGGGDGSETETDEHRKVTCTTIVFNDDNTLSGSVSDKKSSKKKATENSNGGLTSWISRSNSLKGSGRRQSLDLLIDASDKFASVFQKVGKSLDRRNSESEVNNEQNDFFSFARSDKEVLSDQQVENLHLNADDDEVLYRIYNEYAAPPKNRLKVDISK